ncbi:MAG: hypothetical protein AAFZ07_11520 [Actinomycetota bacterium]
MVRIDVVFDASSGSPYRAPTLRAVTDAAAHLGVHVTVDVVPTVTVDDRYLAALPDAVVIGPGTPYDAPDRAEEVIRTARERGVPLVGTASLPL